MARWPPGARGHIEDVDFSFEGPFGKFDQNQLQRGLKVYTQVCSACHGMQYVPLRTLADEGGPHLPDDQMRAYAQQFEVYDEEIDDFRPAKPTDHFPMSQLETAPDLSLMAKKRAGFHGPYGTGLAQLFKGMGGAEYIYSLMIGYEEPPACAPDDMEGSYNAAFTAGGYPDECKDEHGNPTVPGSWISMGQPLWGDDVEYDDGTEATHGATVRGCGGVPDVDGGAQDDGAQACGSVRGDLPDRSVGAAVPHQQADLGAHQGQEDQLTGPWTQVKFKCPAGAPCGALT